jgi:hypothetical protein
MVGKWLGLSAAAPERHTAAVVADRFDRIARRDTYEQSAGLRDLAEELNSHDDHSTDLLTDAFLAAYKVAPRLRESAEMDPSRLVNHQVIWTARRKRRSGHRRAVGPDGVLPTPNSQRLLNTSTRLRGSRAAGPK